MSGRTAIAVAVIGVVGALGAVVIANWDKIAAKFACVPALAVPANNAVLPQRLPDDKFALNWTFEWKACPEATRYHLFVIGPTASNPVVNEDSLTSATYQFQRSHGQISKSKTQGWTWKVRAYTNGRWGEWSEVRTFNVAPPN
jgi:hypothetical protein